MPTRGQRAQTVAWEEGHAAEVAEVATDDIKTVDRTYEDRVRGPSLSRSNGAYGISWLLGSLKVRRSKEFIERSQIERPGESHQR